MWYVGGGYMSMLLRFKKLGGFEQLLVIVESSPIQKRNQFIKLIEQESPSTAELVKNKILTVEKIFSLDVSILGDIMKGMEPRILGILLKGQAPEIIEKAIATFTHGKKRELESMLKDNDITPDEVEAAHLKLITTVRSMIKNHEIPIRVIAPELDITDLKVA